MLRSPARLLRALSVVLACPGSYASADVIERILAVVDDHPVLLSEVRLVQRLHGEGERAAVDALIDEWLMAREAARLPQAEVTAEEERRALEALRVRLPAAADTAALRRLARRQTAIVKYVEFRFRPQVRVEEAEVRAEAGAEATAESLEDARARLVARDLDRRIEEWVKELRAAAEVRYAEPPPGAPSPAPSPAS
jgi:hypothetical protein